MTERDIEFRNLVYARFVELGRAPLLDEFGLEPGEALAALGRLHDAHTLVLDREGTRIRMLLPFSAVSTAYVVETAGRSWFANCAWDAFGIPAALGSDGHISTRCLDCEERIELDVRDGRRTRRTASSTSSCPQRAGGTTGARGTREESQAILDRVGLTGAFWRLP